MKDDETTYREYNAIIKMIGQRVIISDEALGSALKPEFLLEKTMLSMYRHWELMFRKHIPVVELANEKYPANWWEAFRERWLPEWWLKRHPIEYRHITVDRALNMAFPKHYGDRFTLTVNDELVPRPLR